MLPSVQPPPLLERALSWVPFVMSAALVATAVELAVRRPAVGLLLAELSFVLLVPQFLRRRRLRRVLRSGNVDAVLSAWEASVHRVPHPETMAPLIAATALAAHGFADQARGALERARRGPVWEAAIEQRLVVETLLSVFDGETAHALETSSALEGLPLPPALLLRSRTAGLRLAMGAFARAFAPQPADADLALLKTAARQNPLVYWAMCYAAAVLNIDRGAPQEAARLLRGAPCWPADSAFAAFHQEIAARTLRA